MAVQITQRDVGSVTVLDLAGKLAGESALTLADTVQKLVDTGRQQMLLNLGEVSFVDSGALGTLLSLRSTVGPGGSLKLVNVTSRISDLLVTTKLEVVFDTYESESAALESFQNQSGSAEPVSG